MGMSGPEFHRAENSDERREGICRTCLGPIWNEGGTVDGSRRETGWSDRIERGGDSLVCFKAVDYRHVPLTGREAGIYDWAYQRGVSAYAVDASVLAPSVRGSAEKRPSAETIAGIEHIADTYPTAPALGVPVRRFR